MEAEWDKIPGEVCQNLIESMPRRVEAVLKAKGGHTCCFYFNTLIVETAKNNI